MPKALWQLAVAVLMALPASAQTVVWELPPTDYRSISRFGAGLFLVANQQGQQGLITSTGQVVVPVENDALTGFYDGKALVLRHEGQRDLIAGCLTADGHYSPFKQKFYTLEGQDFFSEGLLTVEDADGLKGYVDATGQRAFKFNKKFELIKPFSEGYAAICTDFYHDIPVFSLYDQCGRELDFRQSPPDVSELVIMTNVVNGLTHVLFSSEKIYTYNLSTGAWTPFTADKRFMLPEDDYLFRYGERQFDVPFQPLPAGNAGLAPTQGDGGYGFTVGQKTVVPCQFQSATPFTDQLSVVRLNDRWGIVRLVEGDVDFAVMVPQSHYDYLAGHDVSCGFSLTAPAAWANKALTVQVSDASGQTIYTGQTSGEHAFSLHPQAEQAAFTVSVGAEGLALWTGEASYTFQKQYLDLQVASVELLGLDEQNGETTDDKNKKDFRANDDYQIFVVATIHNPNAEAVEATVSITGTETLVPLTRTVAIGAGKSEQVRTVFEVTKHTYDDQSVSVSTNRGGSLTVGGLSLHPRF